MNKSCLRFLLVSLDASKTQSAPLYVPYRTQHYVVGQLLLVLQVLLWGHFCSLEGLDRLSCYVFSWLSLLFVIILYLQHQK